MWPKIFVVISLASLCCYMYGIFITITVSEKNACKMTYMFEYPQFVKVNFKENDNYPKYNLYAYSEGRLTENARNMIFTGAPVIFVPGNSGSYKQARSLASVALRKGIDKNWSNHLDYFTVDYNEEYTGLFGGYLVDQTKYLSQCIRTVLNLYKNLPNRPTSVVIVAHSMGGKIAQSLLTYENSTDMVNTLIMLATPMDKPVLSIDHYFETFYKNIETYWSQNREITNDVTNTTNHCCKYAADEVTSDDSKDLDTAYQNDKDKLYPLNKKLLITIGGGSRDILVPSALTTSVFSDIHTMATSMPNVWLTTDHLCTVWCLQQVLVINRFLYSIIAPTKHKNSGQSFIESKAVRLERAKQYLLPDNSNHKKDKLITLIEPNGPMGDWIEDNRRVFSEQFKNGVNQTRFQMIRLLGAVQTEVLDAELINLETDDFLFGCAANEVNQLMRYCTQATSLTHLAGKIPSERYERLTVSINLHKIKEANPTWTHILIRSLPTTKPFQLNIDIHSIGDRQLEVRMPKQYSFSNVNVLSDTTLGSLSYTINVIGMDETYQTMELVVSPRTCSKKTHHATAKVCVPWTKGFDRYHHFTDLLHEPMYVYAPISKPTGYNTTLNPIKIELNLDPNCRYTITMKNSFGMTLSRIVLHFTPWLPANLVAIILLAIKYQISLSPAGKPFKCGSLNSALINCLPFFIVTASKVFIKIILWTKSLPPPDAYEHSLIISILIQGSALAILTISTNALWCSICFFGNAAHKILFKLIQLPIPTISAIVLPILQKFPISVGVLLIGIATESCGGVALICAVVFYFILLAKMYEDYLEEFIFNTAKIIAEKLFGKKESSEAATTDDSKDIPADLDGEDEEHDDNNKDIKKSNDEDDVSESDEDKKESGKSTNGDESSEFELLDTQNNASVEENKQQIEEIDEAKSKEDAEMDAELKQLLKETMEKSAATNKEKLKEQELQRAEYNAIHEGLSTINFHLSLFLLLVILTAINIPSVITWAKNYQYSRVLKTDPSLMPAVATLVSLSFLWQFSVPRNVTGYKVLSNFLYILAAFCIIYCQDSLHRLNYVIAFVFLCIAIHQMLMPAPKKTVEEDAPHVIKMRERIQKLREEMLNEGGDLSDLGDLGDLSDLGIDLNELGKKTK